MVVVCVSRSSLCLKRELKDWWWIAELHKRLWGSGDRLYGDDLYIFRGHSTRRETIERLAQMLNLSRKLEYIR